MEEPDFWNDPERSQELMKELKSKKMMWRFIVS